MQALWNLHHTVTTQLEAATLSNRMFTMQACKHEIVSGLNHAKSSDEIIYMKVSANC